MIEVAHIVARVTTDLTRFNAGMAAAEAKATTTTAKMSLAGARMSKYLTLPILGVGYAAVKSAVHFQDSMTQIQTQAGASAADVKILTKAVMGMAGNTTQGPEQLAKALFHLKSLGYDNARAMDALKISAEGAQIGNADLEETTTALGAAVRTGIGGTETFKGAMEVLNATVGAGNMRMQDMVNALGTGVLPVAKLAGLTLRDVGASMTIFTDEGMNASEAMTRFRTSLMMMQNPSDKAKKAMDAMGFSGEKLGMMVRQKGGFIPTIQFIHDRYVAYAKKMGEAGKNMWKGQGESADDYLKRLGNTKAFAAMARAFGGSRTAGTIMLLVNQARLLAFKNKQIGTGMKNFDASVEASNKTMGAQLRKSWSNVRVALIQLGNALAPVVLSVTKGIAAIASAFTHLPTGVQKFIAGILIALAILGPFLIVLSSMIKLAKDAKMAFMAMRTASVLMGDALLANPIIAIIAVIAIIAILLIKSRMFREFVVYEFRRLANGVKAAMHFLGNFLKKYWPYLAALPAGPIGLMVVYVIRHFRQIVGAIRSVAGAAGREARRIGQAIYNGVIGGVSHLASGLKHALEHAVKHGLTHLWPFSPVEHGGLKYIAEPIMRGAIGGLSPMKARLRGALENSMQGSMAGGYGLAGAAGAYGGAVGSGKMSGGNTFQFGDIHVRDETDIDVLSGRLARRLVLR